MKKVLITGISGFAGSFLAEHLLSKGEYKVYGTTISESSPNLSAIQSSLTLSTVDLLNSQKVEELIKNIKPDEVYHLAALTAPAESFDNPVGFLTNNIAAQINVLEAVRKQSPVSRVLTVSSADSYGIVNPQDLPIDEQTPLNPVNPYAVSKIAQDFLGLQYVNAYKLSIVRVRPFNHIGPRQSPQFVVAKFAKQIAEMEKGKISPILSVGNLDAKRDFTDVRDMVRAYSLILEKGHIGDVYNIGSGISHSIQEIVDKLLSLSNIKITIEQDEKLMRPSDTPELICNANKIQQITHWQPEIPLEKTLTDTLDYWRNIR